METFKNSKGTHFGFAYPPTNTQDGNGAWASPHNICINTFIRSWAPLHFVGFYNPYDSEVYNDFIGELEKYSYEQRENTPCSCFTICDLTPEHRAELYGHLVDNCSQRSVCSTCKTTRHDVSQLS
jgi:hypothetical protein